MAIVFSYIHRALILVFCLLVSFGVSFAADTSGGTKDGSGYVTVTEKIPFANCELSSGAWTENDVTKRQYKCFFEKTSTESAKVVVAKGMQYLVFIGGLLSVLGIVIGGVLYSISWVTDEGKVKAKTYLTASISGFLLLFFLGIILYLVAPWVYQL